MTDVTPTNMSQVFRFRIGFLFGLLTLFTAVPTVASDRDRDGLIGPVHEVVESFIHWEAEVPTWVSRTLYDQEGHQLEFHEWQETHGTLIPKSKRKVLYEYDSHVRLIKLITYGEDGKIVRTRTCSYDEKSRKTGEVDRDDKGREERRWTYSFDNRGNMNEMLSYGPDGHMLSRATWEYDSQDRTVQGMVYKSDGALDMKTIYKYDDKGRRREAISLESNGSVQRREVFHYDQSGRRVEKSDYNAEGTLTFKTTDIYEDDARGNWIKRTPGRWAYDKSGKSERWPTEVITRTITYYQVGGTQK